MRIGGFLKFSLIDYPGKMAAVVFTQGCNFRCRYCHNPELVVPHLFGESIAEEKVLDFLRKRRGYLEGVVVTGGEPTIQKDIISFLDKIRCLGFLIKLDTNGSCPEVLKTIIELRLINYVAMDIKAPFGRYDTVVGVEVNNEKIKESIDIILDAGIDYQFRTTLVKSLCPPEDIPDMVACIKDVKRYVIQNFKPSEKILDKSLLQEEHYTQEEIENFQKWNRSSDYDLGDLSENEMISIGSGNIAIGAEDS